MALKRYKTITSKDIPSFIREHFGKSVGTLSCNNPHWWLHFHEDHVAYLYQCCDAEDCGHYDYEQYTDAEALIEDRKSLFEDSDDWWWKPETSIGEDYDH